MQIINRPANVKCNGNFSFACKPVSLVVEQFSGKVVLSGGSVVGEVSVVVM